MANNTLESISAWMKDPLNNVMLGWDSIAVMARQEVNYLLREEYISRFSSNTYLSPISGEVTSVAAGRRKAFMILFWTRLVLRSPTTI